MNRFLPVALLDPSDILFRYSVADTVTFGDHPIRIPPARAIGRSTAKLEVVNPPSIHQRFLLSVPNALVEVGGRFIVELGSNALIRHPAIDWRHSEEFQQTYIPLSIRDNVVILYKGSTVYLDAIWSDSFYHFCMEILGKLFVLKKIINQLSIKIERIIIRGLGNEFIRFYLSHLGLLEFCIEVPEEPFVAESLLIPSYSSSCGYYSPDFVDYIGSSMRPYRAAKANLPRKVYISGRTTRKIINEEEVVKFLTDHGFAIVNPEQLTTPQQIAIFSNASCIVAPHGGSLANLIYAANETRVLELFGEGWTNYCYYTLAVLLNLKYQYTVEPSDHRLDYRCDLTKLETFVSECR
jgi:hypothetical protein